jgi:hypothetical protein
VLNFSLGKRKGGRYLAISWLRDSLRLAPRGCRVPTGGATASRASSTYLRMFKLDYTLFAEGLGFGRCVAVTTMRGDSNRRVTGLCTQKFRAPSY